MTRTAFDNEIIVDLFAGGGGASTGIEMALGRSPDIAINHDPEAVALHQANHPQTTHYVCDVFEVNPITAAAGFKVGFLWASPDCTFHSKARGGKPHRDRNKARRRRGLAGVVIKWGQTVRLEFSSSERNPAVAEADVKFTPPEGADVIGTPAQ